MLETNLISWSSRCKQFDSYLNYYFQVTELNITFSRRLLTFIQDAMPVRLKEVHMINEPWIFKIVWQLFKPLVRAKLRSRVI